MKLQFGDSPSALAVFMQPRHDTLKGPSEIYLPRALTVIDAKPPME